MNSEPLPFGDPTNIRRENAAAVRKGVAVGCGGCAAIVLVGALFMTGIVFVVLYFMQSSAPAQQTLHAARKSEILRRELGAPLSLSWLVTGSVNTYNDTGSADLSLTVFGPQGEADVLTIGIPDAGGWKYSRMEAMLPSGEKVDLLPGLSEKRTEP